MSALDLLKQAQASINAAMALLDPFNGGLTYPAAVTVDIPKALTIPANAKQLHVPVTLSGPPVNTVVAHVRAYNGTGQVVDRMKPVIFRPGDPLTKTVPFDVTNLPVGGTINFAQAAVPDGATAGNRAGVATGVANAPAQVPCPDVSVPAKFAPIGNPTFSDTTFNLSDDGGPGVWNTAIGKQRTQPGNGETGYYGTLAMGAHSHQADGLHLHTEQFATPYAVGNPPTSYPHLAAAISGLNTPETHFTFGSVEFVAMQPKALGSWPAFWFLSAGGGWPPEFDGYEGWPAGVKGNQISSALHLGAGLKQTGGAGTAGISMTDFGLIPTLDSEFHAYQYTFTPEWIISHMDGIETVRFPNPWAGVVWYPIANVAVKLPSGVYAGGDMVLRSVKVWRTG